MFLRHDKASLLNKTCTVVVVVVVAMDVIQSV